MEIILAADRNGFGIDNQVQNIRDTIKFEDFDNPMKTLKTESKENLKSKLEADLEFKIKTDVKPEIEAKSKIELDNKTKIEPIEEINQNT